MEYQANPIIMRRRNLNKQERKGRVVWKSRKFGLKILYQKCIFQLKCQQCSMRLVSRFGQSV